MRSFDQFDNHLSDSGFKSHCHQDRLRANEKSDVQKNEVPYVWSFIGGIFTVKLYKNLVTTFSFVFHLFPRKYNLQTGIKEKKIKFSGRRWNK